MQNSLVKRLVRLRDRRARDAEGLALVEGAREVERAVQAGWPAELLVTCDAYPSAAALDSAALSPTDHVRFGRAPFEKVSLRQNPDGVIALCRPPQRTLSDIEWRPGGLYLILDGVEKPGNLGALLRSADAAGADAVFVSDPGTDLLNPNVIRASMGSLFALPVLSVDGERLRAALQKHQVRCVVATPHAELDVWDSHLSGAVAIVLGAEHSGVSDGYLLAADEQVRLPMAARAADSLNVATSGALMLFEALRQRRGGQPGTT
jgi:TrmH family RNA methyltransferase